MSASTKSRSRSSAPGFARHRRKCAVCRHPDRDIIENFFIHWYSADWIAKRSGIAAASIYNHAMAAGLHQVRAGRIRIALEHIIQNAMHVDVNAETVIQAIRTYTHIDDRGRWIESPTTHVVIPGRPASAPDESVAARLRSVRRQKSLAAPALPSALESAADASLDPAVSDPENPVSNLASQD